MVATIEDILRIVKSNPFIDGVGYFIEVTASKKLPKAAEKDLTAKMQEAFCEHAQATIEGEDVLGLDFHEHIFTQGEGAEEDLEALEHILRHVESKWGIDHLCIELQFDLARARDAQKELDELLKP
jgi:microsomal dipeptidase-like Zn-dependent dipeptidase